MIASFFELELPVWEKILRAALIYLFLLLVLRLAGKRELGQLNVMDFVLLLILSNAVQNGIIGDDLSVIGAFIGATTLIAINVLAGIAIRRSSMMRKILVGTPSIIIDNGVLHTQAMRRERLSQEDLDLALVEAGASRISEVDKCILEPNGRLVMTLKSHHITSAQLDAINKQLEDLRHVLEKRSTPPG